MGRPYEYTGDGKISHYGETVMTATIPRIAHLLNCLRITCITYKKHTIQLIY